MLIGLEEALPEEEADPAFDSARRSGTVLLTLPPLDTSGAPEIRATLEVVPPGVASSGGSVGPGIEVNTRGLVGWEADTGAWRLTVDVTGPAGRIFATADDASGPGAGLELTVELVKGAEGAPALVIGGDSGTRLVAEELTLSGFASLADGPPTSASASRPRRAASRWRPGTATASSARCCPGAAWRSTSSWA